MTQVPAKDLPFDCRKKPTFLNIEVKISFATVIWPNSAFSMYLCPLCILGRHNFLLSDAYPSLLLFSLLSLNLLFMLFPQAGVPFPLLSLCSNYTPLKGLAHLLFFPETFLELS
jgi:hypothetical protein